MNIILVNADNTSSLAMAPEGVDRQTSQRRPITSAARSRTAVPDGVKEHFGQSMRPWEPLLASSPGVPCL